MTQHLGSWGKLPPRHTSCACMSELCPCICAPMLYNLFVFLVAYILHSA